MLADVNISNSVERGFTVFFAWLPALLAAVAILVIGFIVAKILGNLVGRVLHRVGLDRTLHGGPAGGFVHKITHSPSRLVGRITFWAVFLGAVSLAVTALGIDALTDFVAAVFAYLPNVIAALLIFLVAGAVAAGVATLAQRFMGDTGLGKIVSTVAPHSDSSRRVSGPGLPSLICRLSTCVTGNTHGLVLEKNTSSAVYKSYGCRSSSTTGRFNCLARSNTMPRDTP